MYAPPPTQRAREMSRIKVNQVARWLSTLPYISEGITDCGSYTSIGVINTYNSLRNLGQNGNDEIDSHSNNICTDPLFSSFTDCKGQLLYIAQQMSLNHVNTFYTIEIQNNYKTICIQNTKANTMKTASQCNIELKSVKLSIK